MVVQVAPCLGSPTEKGEVHGPAGPVSPAEDASSAWSAQMSSFYCSNQPFGWCPHPQCSNLASAWPECTTGEGQEPSGDHCIPPALGGPTHP